MKGRMYLKVSGIILIIGGVFSVLFSTLFAGVLGAGAAAGYASSASAGAALTGIAIMLILISVFQVIVGVIGVKNCNNVEKADTCFKLGIALLVIFAISNIYQAIGGSIAQYMSVVFALIIPGLYVYGAYLNKQA